ncbi:type II secretion system F family protein [Halobacteriovorax sp. XZX-3]|uniref:type II secretion system F family protein n=1 Tax=unclassified Halobacteriovorax TaxID=2639665 RepID=UPI000CD070AE|nr:type II secretion system F family protein [Halobacteriovorax sp. DA5]POB13037.1 hypothetical protein C0Z22_10985 [Halobacteriovorax sp. DA5]
MSFFIEQIGRSGLIGLIGLIFFLFCYRYSVGIFDLIEKQTFGTRTYILEKFELLFIDVKPDHVTYALLALSFGLGTLTLITFGLFGSWGGGAFLGLIVGFVGFKAPKPVVDYLVNRRILAYQNQMVDGLTLLSNGLRAGLSVPQALGMVVDEMPPPISEEFNIILQQNRVGVTLEECFENLAERIPTQDNDMFVSSVNILRETGGNLAEVFDTIVTVIRERIRLKQKIDTATAQGKFQGFTIAAMPFVILAIFSANDPTLLPKMFSSAIGIVLFVVACVLDGVGTFFILKIVKIKE